MIKANNFLDISQQYFVCYHGDCLQWEINIYFNYLFCLLLYNNYFRTLNAENK